MCKSEGVSATPISELLLFVKYSKSLMLISKKVSAFVTKKLLFKYLIEFLNVPAVPNLFFSLITLIFVFLRLFSNLLNLNFSLLYHVKIRKFPAINNFLDGTKTR